MNRQQQSALVSVVAYLMDSEEKHYFEELATIGVEPTPDDPYALKSHPDFVHVFRDALALKPLADKGAA